ncbi:MAG: DUF1318 domain-containing protein [Gallionellales bacterium GWA2_60_18]|nr:MAG: DUF1318 domain-containing protein [Gallionellales bacterium GWA2_60_18]
MKNIVRTWLAALMLAVTLNAWAVDLEVNTPGINAIKQSMQARHAQLAPHYASGAVGLTADGLVAMRDAGAVSLAQRQAVIALVAAENRDRGALYAEIANANGHPEWLAEIRGTFAQRWIQRAQPGWWVQSGGNWTRK